MIPFSFWKAAAAGWAPQSDADCLAWFDGRVISQSGGSVTAWADQSASGLSATPPATAPDYIAASITFNGENCVDFGVDGTTRLEDAFGAAPTLPITILLVGQSTSGGNEYFHALGSNTCILHDYFGYPGLGMYNGASLAAGSNGSAPFIALLVFNGASSAFYLNDPVTAVATGNTNSGGQTPTTTLTLGNNTGGGGVNLNGPIAAWGLFDGALDVTRRTELMNGAAARFGL